MFFFLPQQCVTQIVPPPRHELTAYYSLQKVSLFVQQYRNCLIGTCNVRVKQIRWD